MTIIMVCADGSRPTMQITQQQWLLAAAVSSMAAAACVSAIGTLRPAKQHQSC
jgi:hypothetical protein